MNCTTRPSAAAARLGSNCPRSAAVAATRCRGWRKHAAALRPRASVVWRQLDASGAWVVHARTARRPTAIVHFLGGAFAGAAPQVAYHSLCGLLAERAGATVIATPYPLTFRHLDSARAVSASFDAAVAELRASGRAYLAPPGAPVLGVGHSNGALLHALAGALAPGRAAGNALVSFNNKQVSDAVPVPGLLDGLRPAASAARAAASASASASASQDGDDCGGSNSSSGGASPAAPAALLVAAAATAVALPPGAAAAERALIERAATPTLEQVGGVLGEVADGTTEFTPPPAESRAIIRDGYRARSTLLVRFEDDSIDETELLAQVLQGEEGGSSSSSSSLPGGDNGSSSSRGSSSGSEARRGAVTLLRLPGTHLTPCGADFGGLSGPSGRQGDGAQQHLADELAAWVRATAAAERAAPAAAAATVAAAAASPLV